jgi:hypothetical protein
MPFWQIASPVHMCPQLPQLSGFVWTSMHPEENSSAQNT